ncbi:MAG: NFACT RNA binding domain-containing protein [Ignavibacteriaceae bacterium]
MFKNYFFLNKIIIEANKLLKAYLITNIFSQEKDKIIFELSNKIDQKYLEVSVNPVLAYITLKNNFHRAKKNTMDFFSKYLPAELISFQISEDDRIIKLKTKNGDFYFTIRGKYTNLFLIQNNEIADSFKNIVEDSQQALMNEFETSNFIEEFNLPNFNLDESKNFETQIKNSYSFVGKEILNETKFRTSSFNSEDLRKTLNEIILEIKNKNPAVFLGIESNEQNLAVESFKSFPFQNVKVFDNIFEALNFFLAKAHYYKSLNEAKKKIQKNLSRELEKIASKINNVKARVDRKSKEEEYKKIGNLLLINLHSHRKGMSEIVVQDIYENNELIKIRLNEKLSSKKNVDAYFEKAKNEKVSFEKSKQLLIQLKNRFEHLKKIEERFLSNEDLENYKLIMKELKIKDNIQSMPKGELHNKFKQYLIEKKYTVFVGKDSKNNDLLTTRFAKQNDYWFHARSVSGSHVVLKVENTKEAIPKNILKKTAALAAYHSKAKTSGIAPVSFTQKKYVVKKKGMEPGKVALLKEEVLIVKPEIPSGCEYIINE